jgi:hypothetical protein
MSYFRSSTVYQSHELNLRVVSGGALTLWLQQVHWLVHGFTARDPLHLKSQHRVYAAYKML